VIPLADLIQDLRALRTLPRVTICLRASETDGNDPFYERMVMRFYKEATSRHPRLFLIRNMQYGVALFSIPEKPDDYFGLIDGSARRNIKKAQRMGYSFSRIDYNSNRAQIAAIIRSTPVRQGAMPVHLMTGEVPSISDPPSKSKTHDYVYVGITKENELRAYAGCMVSGELFAISDIYGHHEFQPDGIVPMMIYEIVKYARTEYPGVRYCMYDKYFGASTTLRRFKKKFCFLPHRVEWRLD
jgi:hypothetical protein